MKNLKKWISLVLALVLICGALSGVELPRAAAAQTQSLAQLLNAGAIKPLGRTMAADGKLLTVWSGSGFEMNVFAPVETTLTVGYDSTYSCYWAVLVDGVQATRVYAASGAKTFSATIPYGNHTVTVVQECQISTSASAKCYLTSISLGATLLAAPAEKEWFIEFVGDSYSCGSGALVDYTVGVKDFSDNAHSATHSFPWYTAQALNADYSIVARGGIGLFNGSSAMEEATNTVTMKEIYEYNAGYNQSFGKYSFSRQPDVVVVELGANDTIDEKVEAKTIEVWKGKMISFLQMVRRNNPNAAIVCVQHDFPKYSKLVEIVDSGDFDNIYAYFHAHNGNGGAAINWQTEGHPSAEDHQLWGKNLANFIRYNSLLPETKAEEPTYKDVVYYVAEGGSDSNDGLSLATAKASVLNVITTAKNRSWAAGERLKIFVKGTVLGTPGQSIDGYNKLRANGQPVPVLITTYEYDKQTDNKAVVQLTYNVTWSGGGKGNANRLLHSNDVTYQNVELKSVLDNSVEGNLPIFQFHAGGQKVVLDNVKFSTTGSNAWIVAADHYVTTGNNFLTATASNPIYSSVTFKNGDYTNLGVVSPVVKNNIHVSGQDEESRSKAPHAHCKIVVEDGAKMGTIYGRYDNMAVGSTIVEVNGGTVEKYVGTVSGTSSAVKKFPQYQLDYTTDHRLIVNGGVVNSIVGTGNYVNYTGQITHEINGGAVYGFRGLGDNMTLNGNLNNIITSGKIEARPTAAAQNIYFSGGNASVVNGNVTNNISGGDVRVYTSASIDTLLVFGGEKLRLNGTLLNKISGGTFTMLQGTANPNTVQMLFGSVYSNGYTKRLRNEITGGMFYLYKGSICMGGRGLDSVYEKIENVIGTKDHPGLSPRFMNANVYLGGNWGQIGCTSYISKESQLPTSNSDAVVLSNTIYGGTFTASVYAGVASGTSVNDNYYECVKGSVENNIYGGNFLSGFYGTAAKGRVYGKVTTNIYGGNFTNFYGAGANALIYDGLEINIYGMKDFQLSANNKSTTPTIYTFDIGNSGTGSIAAATAGRPAIKLTIDGQKPEDVAIYKTMNLTATEAASAPVVEIKSGTFPTGLNLTGAAVEDVLAAGSVCFVGEQKVTPEAGATTLSGAVTVKSVPAMIGDTIYESLQEALQNAQSQQTVQLGKDAAVEMLRINSNKKLDISGNVLTVADMLSVGHFVDSSNGKGLLKISKDSEDAILLLRSDNQQIPIYDAENGGYRFFDRDANSLGSKSVTAGVKEKFGFRVELPTPEDYALLANAEQSGVSIRVTVAVGDRLTLLYEYSPELVADYARRAADQLQKEGQVKVAFTLTLSGLNSVQPGEVVTISPVVKTEAGVIMELETMTWTPAQ